MIPKIIHYCWFGDKNPSRKERRCINSWKRLMPDYKLIEWNESNFNVNCNPYVFEAYQEKKWAFVSDYIRYWAIYNYGGIYLDTDVLLLKSLNELVEEGPFFGREQTRDGGAIASGLGMAAEKENQLYKKALDMFNTERFILPDKSYNLMTEPQRLMKIINSENEDYQDKERKIKINGITIYPAEYLCPMGYDGIVNITNNTFSIHLYNASWFSSKEKRKFWYRRKKNRLYNKIRKIIKHK